MVKLIDFWAPWCGNCKAFAPVIDAVVQETGVAFEKVDASVNGGMCEKFNITNIPVIVITKDDKEVLRINGIVSKDVLLNKVRELTN